MKFDYNLLDATEKIIFALRSVYNDAGYRRYRMAKFEEYDLYSRNKDFLVSDSVITFTDTSGKLMALKPDVTLSIIKNNRDPDEGVQRLCYNESVYRVSKNTGNFREIEQTGLECFGDVDTKCISEVLRLAADSLNTINESFILELSDLDIFSTFLDRLSAPENTRHSIIRCAGEKNMHGIREVCVEAGIGEEKYAGLIEILQLFGSPVSVLPELDKLCISEKLEGEFTKLKEAVSIFEGGPFEKNIQIDFSSVGDMNYYNGIVFRGFIEGIPESVLSGGQYDRLMDRMCRKSKAIGFAVYLDFLERMQLSGQ